jgi:hypothetical protein
MTTLAIKNFFAHQREVNARRKAYYARLEQEMNNPPVTIEDTAAFDKEVEEFDFLLKRNWFLDDESIADFLMEADEDIFREIVNRIATYPYNVQQVIFAFLPLPIRNVKLKVHDLTDEDMTRREMEAYLKTKNMMAEGWEAYKKEKNLQPPVGYLDSELDDLFAGLQATKKDLEDAKKKSISGRYVPPSMRDKVTSEDPRVLAILKKIETMENEISIQKERIEQSHDEWFNNKRNEFEKQQMLSL